MQIFFHEKPCAGHHILVLALLAWMVFCAAGPVWHAVSFTFAGAAVEGTVTHVEWRRGGSSRSRPYCHFTYRNAEGELVRGVTKFPAFFVSVGPGDRVPIRVRNADAELALVNHLWGMPSAFLLVIGVLIAVVLNWCRENVRVGWSDGED